MAWPSKVRSYASRHGFTACMCGVSRHRVRDVVLLDVDLRSSEERFRTARPQNTASRVPNCDSQRCKPFSLRLTFDHPLPNALHIVQVQHRTISLSICACIQTKITSLTFYLSQQSIRRHNHSLKYRPTNCRVPVSRSNHVAILPIAMFNERKYTSIVTNGSKWDSQRN